MGGPVSFRTRCAKLPPCLRPHSASKSSSTCVADPKDRRGGRRVRHLNRRDAPAPARPSRRGIPWPPPPSRENIERAEAVHDATIADEREQRAMQAALADGATVAAGKDETGSDCLGAGARRWPKPRPTASRCGRFAFIRALGTVRTSPSISSKRCRASCRQTHTGSEIRGGGPGCCPRRAEAAHEVAGNQHKAAPGAA